MRVALRTARLGAIVLRSPIRSRFVVSFNAPLAASASFNIGHPDKKTSQVDVPSSSSVTEVVSWASRPSALGGAGLDEMDAEILRRERIDGAVLLTLTDTDLKGEGMTLGARVKLRAAIASLREPRGALFVSSTVEDQDVLSVSLPTQLVYRIRFHFLARQEPSGPTRALRRCKPRCVLRCCRYSSLGERVRQTS